MGRPVLLAALLVTGCSFSGAAGDGGTDDTDDTDDTSGDSSVDDGTPDSDVPLEDSSTGDASSADTDGDGYPDDVDNCPRVAQLDQRDHDLDQVGDVCDPCPHLTDNTDTDEDGVGNLCDPNPDTPGDTQLGFYGFDDGSVDPSTWTRGGDWVMSGGRLAPAMPSFGPQFIALPTAPGTVYVMAGMTVDLTRQGQSKATIIVGHQGSYPNLERYYACRLERELGSLGWNAQAQRDGDMALDFNQGGLLGPSGVGTPVTYSVLLSGAAFQCRWTSMDNVRSSSSSPIGERGDAITLAVEDEGLMSVDYVFLAKPGG